MVSARLAACREQNVSLSQYQRACHEMPKDVRSDLTEALSASWQRNLEALLI